MPDIAISGIYKITCLKSGRFYIGSAANFKTRFRIHKSDLNLNKHHSPFLQRHWNKYGSENFLFSVLEGVNDLSKLIEREQFYLNTLNPPFNTCKNAANTLGYKHSAECCLRMSEKKKGKASPRKGSFHSQESKEKMSKAKKGTQIKLGTKHTDEAKKKMSEQKKGTNSPRARAVRQFDKNKTLIASYGTLTEAFLKTGVTVENIRNVLTGRSHFAGGFIWEG